MSSAFLARPKTLVRGLSLHLRTKSEKERERKGEGGRKRDGDAEAEPPDAERVLLACRSSFPVRAVLSREDSTAPGAPSDHRSSAFLSFSPSARRVYNESEREQARVIRIRAPARAGKNRLAARLVFVLLSNANSTAIIHSLHPLSANCSSLMTP